MAYLSMIIITATVVAISIALARVGLSFILAVAGQAAGTPRRGTVHPA